jgi:hypothetical protein
MDAAREAVVLEAAAAASAAGRVVAGTHLRIGAK